jgi:hypothetical protein
MANPNIVNVTGIYGKTQGQAVTTTLTDFVVNPSSSGKIFKINTLTCANINGTAVADVTVVVSKAGTEYYLAFTIAVPNDASLVVITKESSIYLEENDKIRVQSSINGYLQVICSYEEIS